MDITPIKIEVEVPVDAIEAILDSFLEHTYGSFPPEVLEKAGMPSKKVYTEQILSDPKFTEMIIETLLWFGVVLGLGYLITLFQ